MQVIGYDDAHFEHEFKASLWYMNSCLKKMGWGGEKVKGHEDQWVKSTCYINVSTWAWSLGPHKSWHAVWTSGLPQFRRQTGDSWELTGQLSSLAYAAGKQRPCPQKRWKVMTDTWSRPVISICTLAHAYPRSHVWVATCVHVRVQTRAHKHTHDIHSVK